MGSMGQFAEGVISENKSQKLLFKLSIIAMVKIPT